MITYDTARVQYSSYRIFLAVDSDELLIPDPHSPQFQSFQRKHISSNSLSSFLGGNNVEETYPPPGFKAFITKTLSKAALANTEEIMVFRYSAAATTPSGLVHTKKLSEDGDMISFTSSCLNEGNRIV